MNPPCVLIPESGMYANPTKEMIIYMAGPLVGGIGAIAMGFTGLIMHSFMDSTGMVYVAMYACLANGYQLSVKLKGSDGNKYRKAMNEQYENESKRHLRPGLAVLKYIFAAGCATSLCGVLFLFCLLFLMFVWGENGAKWKKNKEEKLDVNSLKNLIAPNV